MKYAVKNALIFLFFLFTWHHPVIGQDVKFNRVSPVDGGNFGGVTGITQDKNGYIWFSTKSGFYKYDGNELISYRNEPLNPNSVISDNIVSIAIDTSDAIWLGTVGAGLDLYQPETGTFTHFAHDEDDPASLSNDTIIALLNDQEGKLWIGTHQGLDQFDPATNTFIHFRSRKGDSTSLSFNQVRVLYEDRQGTLWVGTGSPWPSNGGGPEDGGLNRFDRQSGTFTRFKHSKNDIHSLVSNKISSIYEDTQGVLWVGTGSNGLHKMNRKSGTFERMLYDPSNPENMSGPEITKDTPPQECITFMTQDVAGNYWYGTYQSGLFYFNPQVGKMVKYKEGEPNSGDFDDYGARSAFTSKNGIFWIGSTLRGLYRIDPMDNTIPNKLIPGAPVNCFFEEPEGILWIGTAQNLIRIDRVNGDTIKYELETDPSGATATRIYAIKRDRQGTLWIGSGNGLYYRDEANNKFISYRHDPNDKNSISNNRVVDILEDSKDNFWISTFNGLNLLNRETGKFTSYFVDPSGLSSAGTFLFTTVLEDNYGKFWIGAWNGDMGVNLFDRETKTFKNYLKNLYVSDIYEDSENIIWVGTSEGLYKYDWNADKFVRYDDTYTIRRLSRAYNIVEDNQKYLWIGSLDAGIVRINPERNSYTLFGKEYGIAGTSLTINSVYKGLNGALYFGNTTGYYKIDPDEFLRNSSPPGILITGFHLADQMIQPDKAGPLKEDLQDAKEINLQHDQNVFSIDFNIIDYINPDNNRLLYFLENYDNTWLQSNNKRRAYYFNVPPGKYVFRVKGTNSDGIWAEKKIDIVISPPWWKTWWAYFFYALLFGAAIFGFDRFQRRRIILAERQKTQKRELAQAREIEKAYTELKATQTQLIHSEKMASLGELTAGIAHEIQNPLNFVNNFSEVNAELIEEVKEEWMKLKTESQKLKAEGPMWNGDGDEDLIDELLNDIQENERKISHHGKRADAIVKGMLQHSRGSKGEKELTDLNALCDEYLRLAYHGLRAKDKSFNASMETDFDSDIPEIPVIPQDMGRVILNLITNAFYAVGIKAGNGQADFNPEVFVRTKMINSDALARNGHSGRIKGGKMIEISVEDNGSGIPANVIDKIFQPFFTTKPTGQGTGLGLSMSYDIIKAHGGELKVKTKEGEGTTFTVVLPIKGNRS